MNPKEKKKKKEMAPRLKVSFKERHCKHLFEAFPTALLPAKKSRLEAPREESAPDTPMVQVPFTDVVGPDKN